MKCAVNVKARINFFVIFDSDTAIGTSKMSGVLTFLQGELNGIAQNFQNMVNLGVEGSENPSETGSRVVPHLGSWKRERGIQDERPKTRCAVLEGKFIHTLGLILTRKEIRLKKRICPSALVVVRVDDGSEANKNGVTAGDVVMMIGIISTAFLKGSEIVELINHTIELGEKVRFSFECQDTLREPYTVVLGCNKPATESESVVSSSENQWHSKLPHMSSWRKHWLALEGNQNDEMAKTNSSDSSSTKAENSRGRTKGNDHAGEYV